MQDVAKWHHGVPSQDEYETALAELDQMESSLAEVAG
jgi:hypothetical protein